MDGREKRMGTASQWLSVLLWGGLWGAFMVWLVASPQDASLPRRERILSLAVCAPIGVNFGIVTTFGWQAWHRPLVFVTVGLFLGIFLVWWVCRRKRAIGITERSS